MSTTTRTDVHAPSSPNFDPAAYSLVDIFDLDALNAEESARFNHLTSSLEAVGYTAVRLGTCGHCGNHLRYAALMTRSDVMDIITVGQECLDNRFAASLPDFKAMQKRAADLRAEQRLLKAFEGLCDDAPALAYATYAPNLADQVHAKVWGLEVVADIARRARRTGKVSTKQVDLVERVISEMEAKDAEYRAKDAEREASDLLRLPIPAEHNGERVEIVGTMVSVQYRDNDFGGAWKMLVEHADGWKVWGTVPRALEPDTCDMASLKGTKVSFVGKIEISNDDPTFGFVSRPAKAKIVEEA